jgi:hypothetical protein
MKLQEYSWISIAGLFVAVLLVSGCTGTTSIRNLSPIQPPEELPESIVLDSSDPERFEFTPRQPVLSMTQNDVTIEMSYWRRYDLDRKFNRGNVISPFYETEALHQGEKTDVFYVKIINNTAQKVLFDVRKCMIVDQGENLYDGLDFDAMQDRLLLMTRVGGMMVRNGLLKAREVLIETQLGKKEDGVESGQSIEGFLPFRQLKHNALSLEVIVPLEIAPPENTAERYKRLEYRFPFTHDRGIRIAQPPPQRF